MKHGDLFSGIGGFDLAAERAGIRVAWQSEIDPYASAVLRKHWPDVPNHGDITTINGAEVEPVDIITGGFPCQDLSVAGRRAGLDGERSGLYFEIIRLVREMRDATDGRFPTFVVLENVPGLLSSHGGRDFAVVLRELRQLGALDIGWRVLDAQHFGVPQRRRRVFVVADFGAERSGQILFESESSGGDSAPCRAQRQDVAGTLESRTTAGGFPGTDGAVANHVVPLAIRTGGDYADPTISVDDKVFLAANPMSDRQMVIAAPLTAGSNPNSNAAGRRREDDENLVAFEWQASAHQSMNPGKVAASVKTTQIPAIAHSLTSGGHDASEDGTGRGTPLVTNTLRANAGMPKHEADNTQLVTSPMAVRRLMPIETERLQGFPDNWTAYGADGAKMSDSARYRMCGNAVAVPVVEWLLNRVGDAA